MSAHPLLLLATLAFASPAAAASLERARQLAAALDYPAALTEAQAALEAGAHPTTELVELHLLVGQMAAAVGERERATAAFTRARSIDPGARLPEGSSPRVIQPFDEAGRALQGRRLQAEVRSTSEGARVTSIVQVTDDPAHLVATSTLARAEDGRFLPLESKGLEHGWACLALPCAHVVTLLDAHGNTLATLGTPYLPLEVPGVKLPGPKLRALPIALTAAAVVATGVAIGFGVHFGATDAAMAKVAADRSQTTFSEARALEAQRHQSWTITWVAAGSALAAAGGAAWAW